MNKEEYIKREEGAMLHTYNRFPVVLEKGEGVYLYDTDGKKYLDFAAGIAVEALGYGNRKYNDALKDQIDKLMHTSNLYYNLPIMEAAFLPWKKSWGIVGNRQQTLSGAV